MKAKWVARMGTILAPGALVLGLAGASYAQTTMGQPAQTSPKQMPGSTATPADSGTPPSLAAAPAPVNAEEDATFKAFQDAPLTDANQKIALGEAFEQKYPASRYNPVIYSTMTQLYFQTNQPQKMVDAGEKAVQLTPTDVQSMAILAQIIPRSLSGGADSEKELAKAEDYSKRAIEMTPTISKPPNVTEEQFVIAKNVTLAMAHGGLGLVYFRRDKFDAAIPELEQSLKIDPEPDPVNYYVLGLANEKASHFQDAVAAFTKCANMQSSLQSRCKTSAEEAKKLGNTQLSVPK